ncbi:MAG: thioredoxin family protein [Chitinophagaceae bacterium]
MKKVFLAVALLLSSFASNAQYGFDISKDDQTGRTMFVGRCTFDDLNDEASFDWIAMGSGAYNPDPAVTEELKKALPACQLVIFMGTWCEDTQNLLPKLYKTMMLSRSYTNYKMYALDRSKKSKDNEQDPFKVTLVPTIIIMKDGVELGRIVEAPKQSIETDLLAIVSPKKN